MSAPVGHQIAVIGCRATTARPLGIKDACVTHTSVDGYASQSLATCTRALTMAVKIDFTWAHLLAFVADPTSLYHAPQCDAAHPLFASFLLRKQSFDRWAHGDQESAVSLASAGFFADNDDGHTVCFSCGGKLKCWEGHHDPWTRHATSFPACKYVLKVKGTEFVALVRGDSPSTMHTEVCPLRFRQILCVFWCSIV